MTEQQSPSNADRKNQMFDRLRREILAARLKVTLDEQLKRETSPTVKALADMKLPSTNRIYRANPSYGKSVRPHQGDISQRRTMTG